MDERLDPLIALTQRIELFSQEVQHQNKMLADDVARVSRSVDALVSIERYTIEQGNQDRDHEELKTRVTELERARETTRHMLLSSFLFPLIIAVGVYLLTSAGA
jgi:hypothetical protein